MNATRTTKNPKKLRRLTRIALKRVLTIDEVLHLHDVAILVNAPETARIILNLRGEVTEDESFAIRRLIRLEAMSRAAALRRAM